MNTLETVQTILDKRADARLRREVEAIFGALHKHINNVPGYPKIMIGEAEHTIDTRFMSAMSDALFNHSAEHNRSVEATKFLEDTESLRDQLEELRNAKQQSN